MPLPFTFPIRSPLGTGIVLGWPRHLCFIFCVVGGGPTETHLSWPGFLLVVVNLDSVLSVSLGPPLCLCFTYTPVRQQQSLPSQLPPPSPPPNTR